MPSKVAYVTLRNSNHILISEFQGPLLLAHALVPSFNIATLNPLSITTAPTRQIQLYYGSPEARMQLILAGYISSPIPCIVQ